MNKIKDVPQRLSRARTTLVMKHPFFGMLALNMPFVVDPELSPPTALTNGKEVRFHPMFCNDLNDSELLFLVAHEVMHPVLDHVLRRNGRDPKRWNIACDIVVNRILTEEGIGRMPEMGIDDPVLFRRGEGIAEKIYDLLAKQEEGGGGEHTGKEALDQCADAPGDAAERAVVAAEMKSLLVQAAAVAKQRGALSANIKRFVDDCLHPHVDWRDVLRRFVVRARTDERSFNRPNRRFSSLGLIMPSVTGEEMGELVVAVDCSGSIGRQELNAFGAEVTAIHQDVQPKTIHVVYFDSRVCHHDRFEQGETPKLEPYGGGGTAFSPIFKFIAQQDITPVACVVLTDLYCSDFGAEPDYPVLWVTNGNTAAPWGEVVKM